MRGETCCVRNFLARSVTCERFYTFDLSQNARAGTLHLRREVDRSINFASQCIFDESNFSAGRIRSAKQIRRKTFCFGAVDRSKVTDDQSVHGHNAGICIGAEQMHQSFFVRKQMRWVCNPFAPVCTHLFQSKIVLPFESAVSRVERRRTRRTSRKGFLAVDFSRPIPDLVQLHDSVV